MDAVDATDNKPRLVLLVGPKGAGKSTLGAFLAEQTGAAFVRVEPIYLGVLRANPGVDPATLEPAGFGAILTELVRVGETAPLLCIESTGAAGYFPMFLSQLRERFRITIVRVSAPAETCVERVRTRVAAGHIPVSDDRVREINRVAESVRLPWDLEIDNDGQHPAEAVAREIAKVLCLAPRG